MSWFDDAYDMKYELPAKLLVTMLNHMKYIYFITSYL